MLSRRKSPPNLKTALWGLAKRLLGVEVIWPKLSDLAKKTPCCWFSPGLRSLLAKSTPPPKKKHFKVHFPDFTFSTKESFSQTTVEIRKPTQLSYLFKRVEYGIRHVVLDHSFWDQHFVEARVVGLYDFVLAESLFRRRWGLLRTRSLTQFFSFGNK